MGFAADAVRQQQWLYPGAGAMSPSFGRSRAVTSPLLTPHSTLWSSSSSATTSTSRPLTPDMGGNTIRTSNTDDAAVNTKAPALPQVYRLSSWPDFEAREFIGMVGKDYSDHNLVGICEDSDSPVIQVVARVDDDKNDGFLLDAEGDSLAYLFENPHILDPTQPGEIVDGGESDAATKCARGGRPGPESPKNNIPAHRTLSTRALTAKEYQQYRLQRQGGEVGDLVPATAVIKRRSVGSNERTETTSPRMESLPGPNTNEAEGKAALARTSTERRAHHVPPTGLMTKEDFEALPPAIQRKYFSTLERLRLTQAPNITIDSSQATNNFYDFSPAPAKLRKTRRPPASSHNAPNRLDRRSGHRSRTLSVDSGLHPHTSRGQKGPQRRRAATRNRAGLSIIVDAADEGESGFGRQSSRTPKEKDDSNTVSHSEPTSPSAGKDCFPDSEMASGNSSVLDSLYESFKCLDQGSELDLQLRLDDYGDNARDQSSASSGRRNTSFRRHLSISKMNLGRSSQASSRPSTKGTSRTAASPAPTIASPTMPSSPFHARRKSRTLSLRTASGPIPTESVTTPTTAVDPSAAHYQDPEARLKLRVYLASPQKFDEAVEFGFPSEDVLPKLRDTYGRSNYREPNRLRKQQSCFVLTPEAENKTHVFPDDKSSVYSDELSTVESDSPKTPEPVEKPPPPQATRGFRAKSDVTMMAKAASEYSQAAASAREMTLRMTLTRPDLRACEAQIYGWQQQQQQQQQQRSHPVGHEAQPSVSAGLKEELSPTVVYIRDGNSKDSIERQFAAMDQWVEPERGMVKRFWNRVRRQ